MRKNEDIILAEAYVTISVIVFLNILLNTQARISSEMGSFIDHPVVLFIINVVGFGGLYAIIHFIFKFLWRFVRKDIWVGDKWFIIQYFPEHKNDVYLRIGEAKVKQRFYDAGIEGKTVNVEYEMLSDDIETIKPVYGEEETVWKEPNGTIMESNIEGVYLADRGTQVLRGFHRLNIDDQWKNPETGKKSKRIFGHFVDIGVVDNSALRCGTIEMYRTKEEQEYFVKKLCRERKGSDGKYRSRRADPQ